MLSIDNKRAATFGSLLRAWHHMPIAVAPTQAAKTISAHRSLECDLGCFGSSMTIDIARTSLSHRHLVYCNRGAELGHRACICRLLRCFRDLNHYSFPGNRLRRGQRPACTAPERVAGSQ